MLGDQVNEIQLRVSANEDNIAELVKRVKVLEKENTDLKAWTEDAENRSRRSNLRFIGIPEKAEAKDILGFMSHLIPQVLGETHFSVPPMIERCYRIGIMDNVKAKGPRPILVKFQHFQDKLKIMKLARDNKDILQYKARAVNQEGSSKVVRVYIYPDFSTGVVQRRREFDSVKKKFRDRDIEYGLIFPSTLRVTHAATVEENGAGFTGVSEISPVRFPSLARRVPKPSPCIKLWDILLDSGCLIPVEAGLQKCSFDVLNQCSLGGWQVLEFLPFEKRGEPQNTNSPTQRNQIKN
ncbi:unnamed protein product [Leuciscus chuanchicus]